MGVISNNTSVFVQTIMFMVNQSIIQEESYNYYFLKLGEGTNATRCYGMYGCFGLSSPWTSEHRPVSLFPEDLSKIDPRYHLYTRQNPSRPTYIDINEWEYNLKNIIKPEKPLYLVSHGYIEGGGIGWIVRMAQELLKHQDCNVIVVDWQGGSGPPYTQAVANIRLVGAVTAHLLSEVARYTGKLKLDHVHCIGHSLGAHMSGYVGYTLQNEYNLTLGRITGLDPAEPHFGKEQPPVRLDRSAAKYVDVIHTDASQFMRGGLGITESIGHVDYYPNGGTEQPGCMKTVFQYIKDEKGSVVTGVRKYLGCNHLRSHEYFIESINPKCSFMSVSCASYKDFLAGKCFDCGRKGEKCIRFGFHGKKHYEKLIGLRNRKTSAVQYLITGDSEPWCRCHYRVIVQIGDDEESKQHGGEIGQLMFSMHSTSDGKGMKTKSSGFISGYHEPGAVYVGIIASQEINHLKAVEIEWKYNSSLFNPLTWRLLTTPKIYLKTVTVQALEIGQSITVCPKDNKPFVHARPQLLLSSYC